MIITEEVKSLAIKTCQNPDPHMRHCQLVGFYAGYAAGYAAGVNIQKEIDAPKFKTLEDWGWTLTNRWSVETPFGTYFIWHNGTTVDLYNRGNLVAWFACNDIAHGKQLAQEDFDKRIKSMQK